MYVKNRLQYRRFQTRVVHVGDLKLGGTHPIRIQSMTNTPTTDVDATVAQIRLMVDAGAELVRVTAPGIEDARALGDIRPA
jgi:(E)-4-hydroxy-3-methylbut-2-enyl-diphosphate synthase